MDTVPSSSTNWPDLRYKPQNPKESRPAIGLIGCGGISEYHLKAYRSAGYSVRALCDVAPERAEKRRKQFYPEAVVYQDYRDLLEQDDLEVIDISTHPRIRATMIEAALLADKHVLSQKPFVLDLDVGQRLADLACQRNLRLAVNQNARWAPHFSYLRAAVEAGLLGDITGVHMSVHWDHSWVRGTEFENVHHLILYDYAIHWFDMVSCLFGTKSNRVYASLTRSPNQAVQPPLLGQAIIEFDAGQASLAFDGHTSFGNQDRTYVAGTEGSFSSIGPGNRVQSARLTTAQGTFSPALEGSWFPDGFHGTMGELLCSIEEKRIPTIDALNNLDSLALCFAAVSSAETHSPVEPGIIRRLPGH